MSLRLVALSVAILAGLVADKAQAHENEVEITQEGSDICIRSNGTPDHDIGQFPNSGNPNSFIEQSLKYCVPAEPKLTGQTTHRVQISGVTLTGLPLRPGTADWYDASTRRGFSRDRSSGWNLEGMGAADQLGMDQNAAHVDNRGLYHYHGISAGLLSGAEGNVIALAPDGFDILYAGKAETSSWQLKSGTRPTDCLLYTSDAADE